MIIGSLAGDPIGAIVAAIVAPVCFIILFVLLAHDLGPRRRITEGHPAYVVGHDERLVADDREGSQSRMSLRPDRDEP